MPVQRYGQLELLEFVMNACDSEECFLPSGANRKRGKTPGEPRDFAGATRLVLNPGASPD